MTTVQYGTKKERIMDKNKELGKDCFCAYFC